MSPIAVDKRAMPVLTFQERTSVTSAEGRTLPYSLYLIVAQYPDVRRQRNEVHDRHGASLVRLQLFLPMLAPRTSVCHNAAAETSQSVGSECVQRSSGRSRPGVTGSYSAHLTTLPNRRSVLAFRSVHLQRRRCPAIAPLASRWILPPQSQCRRLSKPA